MVEHTKANHKSSQTVKADNLQTHEVVPVLIMRFGAYLIKSKMYTIGEHKFM